MISGANDSAKDFAVFTQSYSADVLETLRKRRQNILNGGVNCIPLPFQRFRSDIPGIEQDQYVVVTTNAKVCKTQFTDYLYVFYALDYAYAHPEKCSVHILYFSLEERREKIVTRYLSYLLYKIDGIRMSPTDLRSTSAEYPVPEEILDKIDSAEYQKRLEFFERCVQFEFDKTTAKEIVNTCVNYAKSVGTYTSHKETIGFNETEVIDSYQNNDPNHYKIMIVDHIGIIDTEPGDSLKSSIDALSKACLHVLRNKYHYTCEVVQQQTADTEGLEAIKQKKMVPSTTGLADSKYTQKDADVVLGLFDPSRFGLPQWLGYKIQDVDGTGLRNYVRFMYVLVNRNNEMGGICPLFFDGTVCNFEELPRPDDVDALAKWYNRAQNLKSYRQQRKFSALILLNFIGRIVKKK